MASSSSTSLVHVEHVEGDGVNKYLLRELNGSSAEVCDGHVTSWKNVDGEELLFCASEGKDGIMFKFVSTIVQACCQLSGGGGERIERKNEASTTHEGICISFPEFSNHGFAYRIWRADPDPDPRLTPPDNAAYIDLILTPSEEDIKIWPHSFEFRLRVSLGPKGELKMMSRVRNTNTEPFTFTFAYHTYLRVSDISDVRVEGLGTTNYLDNTKNKKLCTEQEDGLTFDKEVDRVYFSTPAKISICDHGLKKTYEMLKQGLPDTVVWSPGDKKAKDYQNMVCVSPAAVEEPIVLNPGDEWTGRQELSVV